MDYITVKRVREAVATAKDDLNFTRKFLFATYMQDFETSRQIQQLKAASQTLDTTLLLLDLILKNEGNDEK